MYYHGTNNPEMTLAAFDRYAEAGGNVDQDVMRTELEAAEQAGNLKRALRTGQSLLASDPENTELLSLVGRLARGAEDFPRAIEYLQKATQLDPDSFEYRRQVREATETMKKNRITEIKSQLEKTPGDRDLLEELGDLYHDFDLLNEAIASYQRAGRNEPERRIPRAKQGYVLARKGLFTDADEILQEAELRTDLPEEEQEKLKNLFFITAQLMEEEEEQARALELYRRIFRVDAGYRDVVEHIERLQVTSKKKEKKY
jgi:tetratricopeptide (TPR) repeat protein